MLSLLFVTPILFSYVVNVETQDPRESLNWIDTSQLYYGGILNDFISVPANDSDIALVAKVAVEYAVKRHKGSFPLDSEGNVLPWEVLHPKKTKLHYTADNKTPFILEEISEGANGPRLQKRQAILGLIYTFTLAWPSVPNSFNHVFTINKDREKQLFVNSYYFHRPITPLDPNSQDASGQAVLPGSIAEESPQVSIPGEVASCSNPNSQCTTGVITMATEAIDQSRSRPAATTDASGCDGQRPGSVWTEGQDSEGETGEGSCGSGMRMFGRFTTYNIWNFNCQQKECKKCYAQRMQHMGKLLSESDSDIIGIQEMRYDHQYGALPGPSQASQLASHLPHYQFVHQPAMAHWQGNLGRVEEGLALFSKHNILSHDFIMLPRNMSDPGDGPHQRICLHAEIEHPALGIVHVYVAHLSLNGEARERSAVEIWKYMQRHPGLAVLLGDFNGEPHEMAMRFLRGEVELLGHRTEGLLDAWTFFHKEPRPNAPKMYRDDEPCDTGLTFSTLEEHLSKRIDYVYVRLTQDTKLLATALLDDEQRGDNAASDHIGVSAIIAPAPPT